METKKIFSESNHLSENGIALYVDAIILKRIDDLPAAMIHHVEECEECKMQIMNVTEAMALQPYETTISHPSFRTKTISSLPFSAAYRIAAVLVVAAFIGTIYYFLAGRMTDTVQQNESVAAEQKIQLPVAHDSLPSGHKNSANATTEDLFAVNSEPSPNLEDLVQTQFRSTAIEIISPEVGAIVQSPVTFRWKQYDKKITIKILSNKELTLVSSTLFGDSFTTSKKFAPGLYYWKLETADELLFVGKFLVK